MTDCAKNIIILKPEESFKVSFTKLSGALKKILAGDNNGSIFGKQILFDGLLPIDIRVPLFEEFNMQHFKKESD